MKEINLTAKMRAYKWDELTEEQREILTIANGRRIRKSEIPAAFIAVPSGLCAERSALFAAGAQYPAEPVNKLAIACFTGGHYTKEPGSPCGACRQVMLETEHRYGGKMEVLLYGEEETYVFDSAADLLPLIFVKENLKG